MKTRALLLVSCLAWASSTLLTSPLLGGTIVSLELVNREAMETRIDQNAIFWAEFRVLRTEPATDELKVVLSTREGSAKIGVDYWLDGVSDASIVRMPAGTKSVNVRLYPIDDNFYEGDETVRFHLIASPDGAAPYEIDPAHSSVEMVIHDNDPVTTLPVVKIIADPWRTGEPCPTCFVAPAVLTIERTAPTNTGLIVYLEVNGTANPENDYQPLPAKVEIPAGQRSVQLRLLALDDLLAEGPEVVRVRLLPQPPPLLPPTYHVNIHAQEALVAIFDDEREAPRARLNIVTPSNDARLKSPSIIQLSALAVNMENEVYGPVDFYAGDRLVAQSPVHDSTRPPIPGLPSIHTAYWTNPPVGQYTLTARTRLSLDKTLTSPPIKVTVESPNDETPPTTLVSIRAEDSRATELPSWVNSVDPARFQVSRTGDLSIDLIVFFSAGGSATPELDYKALTSPVLIPAGEASASIVVWPVYDELKEGMETVLIQLEPSPLAGPLPTYDIDPHADFAVAGIFDLVDGELSPAVVSIDTVSRISEETALPLERLPLVGVFKVSRTGPVTNSLPVYVTSAGSALSGHDYQPLPFLVTIPEGTNSVLLAVEPVVDDLFEGLETVVAKISNCPPPPLKPPCFDFAIDPTHASATVFIRDDGLTEASLVITSPTNGASFKSGETIVINAVAIDLESYISRVEFFAGDHLLGVSEIVFIVAPPPGTPIEHSFEWRNATRGAHALTVRAVRSNGEIVRSQPVRISVDADGNQAPEIAITQPANGAILQSNTSIEIVVKTRDSDGYVRTVEFFADERKIGERSIGDKPPLDPGQTQLFSFLWTTPAPGQHVLTARAIDDVGGSARSAPIEIRIPLDVLPIVAVASTDNLAVEPALNGEPNTATFRLRRFGPTNSPLTIVYSMRGTAQNGIDYELLSGSAEIPAGSFTTHITVRPLADQLAEGLESVILRLEEQPQYFLGLRRRAIAVISDTRPTLGLDRTLSAWLPDGCFQASFPASNGVTYRVETSSDLLNWETVLTTTAIDGSLNFIEDNAANFPQRFYRLTPEPTPGPND